MYQVVLILLRRGDLKTRHQNKGVKNALFIYSIKTKVEFLKNLISLLQLLH